MKKILLFITLSIIFVISSVFNQLDASDTKKSRRIVKKRVAVLDFSVNNAPSSFSKIVRNMMEVSLYRTDDFFLVEWEQIQKVMKSYNVKSEIDMETSISIGKSLKTDYLIAGSIDKIDEYKITARAISIEDKRILVAYSKEFSSDSDVDPIVESMARNIARDIRRYVKTGKITSRFYDFYDIHFGLKFEYLSPLGKFRMVNPGFGVAFESMVENVYKDNILAGIGLGYYTFTGRDNSSDTCRIIPVSLRAGYNFDLTRRLYVAPVVSAGIAFIRLTHDAGDGFDMEENSEDNLIEPIFTFGASAGIIPVQPFHIVFTANYGFIYEEDGLMSFLTFNLGVSVTF